MPQLDGIGAITRIKAAHPEVQLVALTSFIEEEKVTAALEAGASGFILKDAEADDVAAAIRAAHNDEVHLDPAAARILAKGMRTRSTQPATEPLTERELEVLGARRSGPEQQGDRDGPRDHRADGADPRQQHPRQAGPREPDPGGALRGRTKARPGHELSRRAVPGPTITRPPPRDRLRPRRRG